MLFQFENSVTLGAIINLIGMIACVCGIYYKLSGRVDMHGYRLERIEETIKNVAIILQNNAVTDNRIIAIERTIEALKRGEGFIKGHRISIDGEYNGN